MMDSNIKTQKQVMLRLCAAILLVFFLVQIVSAFGVSTPYFENNTIPLELDQTFEYKILIQNAEDIEFVVDINYTSDADIAKLRETDMLIPPKTYDNEFIFDVSIPNTSLVGDVYTLEFRATPVLNISGQVPMNVQIKRSVDFIVVNQGGVGVSTVTLNWFQKLTRWLGAILERIYVYVLVIIALIISYYIGKRLWSMSKKFATKVTNTKNQQGIYGMISQAKSKSDVKNLIKLIPDKQLDSMRLRQQLSKKLEDLGEKRKAKSVLISDSKENILKSLNSKNVRRRKRK